MNEDKYIYEIRLKVRDYECDQQGIVNNANYQHYAEFARHEFLEQEGIRFSDLHEQGIDPVVARITLSYKTPLRGGDVFACRLYIKKECLKYEFYQDIYRLPDNKLCLKAVVECVCLINGKMKEFKIFDDIFEKYNRQQ